MPPRTKNVERKIFVLVLLLYTALGTLFAVRTPPWQNPDEPAHYNYVVYVATEKRLPVLRLGDYDEAYLQQLRERKFPPELPIDALRYEFHQPPLYYLLASPVYRVADALQKSSMRTRLAVASGSVQGKASEGWDRLWPQLLALRLFSVALGAVAVTLLFHCVRTVAPDSPQFALGAAAFAAFLPMHTAMLASVNNDALGEVVVAGALLALLRWRREVAGCAFSVLGAGGTRGGQAESRTLEQEGDSVGTEGSKPLSRVEVAGTKGLLLGGNRYLLAIGVLIGLGFLTKSTTYVLLPTALIAVFCWTNRGEDGSRVPLGTQLARGALLLAPSLLLGLPWWLRNSLLYGGMDFLGIGWHKEVVTGQPTTAAWIAEVGWAAYWERAWTFTFKSFWGVFGWMGIFMDERIYAAFYALSTMAAVGFAAWVYGNARGAAVPARRSGSAAFTVLFARALSSPWLALVLLLVGSTAAYVWYNLSFVQHQGRYLFSALPTWSLLFAVGWWTTLGNRAGVATGIVLLAVAAGAALAGAAAGAVDRWTVALFVAAGAGLLVARLLSDRYLPAHSLPGRAGASNETSIAAGSRVLRPILYAGIFLALAAVNLVAVFRYVVP